MEEQSKGRAYEQQRGAVKPERGRVRRGINLGWPGHDEVKLGGRAVATAARNGGAVNTGSARLYGQVKELRNDEVEPCAR